MTDKEKLTKAKELIDKGFFEKAISFLDDINDSYHSSKIIETKYLFLAICYYNLELYNKSILYCKKVLINNNSNELASLTKYLSHINVKDFNNAFFEIFEFLKYNPAVLYKDTLGELLADIKSGHINDKDVINAIKILAEENKVV